MLCICKVDLRRVNPKIWNRHVSREIFGSRCLRILVKKTRRKQNEDPSLLVEEDFSDVAFLPHVLAPATPRQETFPPCFAGKTHSVNLTDLQLEAYVEDLRPRVRVKDDDKEH